MRAILVLFVAGGVIGCGGSSSGPSPTGAEVRLAVFTSAASGFSTSDVRDAEDEVVHFDTVGNTLIWIADGRRFPGFPVSGNFIGSNRGFEVRFGTRNGQPRAYFTETGPATICDIEVLNGQLIISPTSVTVPNS